MDSSSSTLLHPPPSTSATTSNPPSASSTGPQIRSRITVVCAECKRLKLKCDRRAPCGSCTKRDTVVRCIYSPAAAEKVDLHSLHNRLIQVESVISMITSGQQPPAFQSSYPLSQPSTTATSAGSSSSTPTSSFNLNFSGHHQPAHQHHHHYAPPQTHPSTNSITLSARDFASIWLDGLDLGVSWLSPSSSHQQAYPNGASAAAGYIKLEPSAIDVALSLSHSSAPTVIDVDNASHFSLQASRPASPLNSSRHWRSQRHASAVQLILPALSIYYPVPSISPPGTSPSSSSAFPHQPSNALHIPQEQQPHYTKPQVTPALLALLPPLERCKRLLQKAREVFRVRPIPFEPSQSSVGAWKSFESRCITLLSGGMSEEKERERERKEKAKQAKRARQIYFGGITGLRHDDAEMDDASTGNGTKNKDAEEQQNTANEDRSLTFFATLCAVLAIGAFYSPSGGDSSSAATDSPAFFYALSQQALGVWDTHVSSTSGSGFGSSSSSAADEAERMDYLLACLVGVEYLMLSGAGEDREEDIAAPNPVYSLVGKLVNAQRSMGLGRDTSSAFRKSKNGLGGPSTVAMSKRAEKERLKEEWRRMVLWQVMYCDLFTADALGHQPYIPSYSYSAKLPSCSSPSSSTSSSSSDAPTGGAEQESEDEIQQSHDDMQHDGYDFSFNTRNTNPNSARQRRGQQQQQPQSTLPDHGTDEGAHSYLGARYRLTQLAQAVKDRIIHPDCCCGYTLDQAAALEDEVRRWYAGLPAHLRAASSSISSSAAAASVSHSSSPSLPDPTLGKSPFQDLFPHAHPDGTASGSTASFGPYKAALVQSCELAMMVNLLIGKIYTPFLRHAASSTALNGVQHQSSSAPTTNIGGVSASAYQVTVHAAQAILRAGRSLSSLSSSRPNSNDSQAIILPSLFDYYLLDKVILDAAVICAHVGLTGKSSSFAFDVTVLLEDVCSGLGLLSDMLAGNGLGSGLGDKQKRVVEALYKRVQHCGGNTSLLKRKYDQVDISGSFVANGATGDSNGETTAPGFDFMDPSGSQYQPTGLPIAQQHQHANLMDTSSASSSRSSIPPCASIPAGILPQDHSHRSGQQQNDLQSALTSVATARAVARHADNEKSKEQNQQDRQHEKEKAQGQKHSKKSHVYPSVGIRVRPGKESSSTSSRSRQQSVSGSTASAAHQHSSVQQHRPLADSVLTFQQQQKQKLSQQGMASVGNNAADVQRSRSSSFSHVQSQPQAELQQPPPMDYSSLPFGRIPPSNSDLMDSLHSKPFTVPDAGTSQAQQQQVASDQSPFTSHPFGQSHSMYERAQQQSYDPSATVSSSIPHSDGMNYGNTISSPFSPPGGPPSSTGSPFTSASVTSSGHPPTPTFNAHHPTPPVFGPQPPAPPPTSSPTAYFQPPNYGSQYAQPPPSDLSGHHRNMSLLEMGIDQTMVPSTHVYDKSRQQQEIGMYDLKPAMDSQSQHHHMLQRQQHMQRQSIEPSNSYEDQEMPGQLSMVISPAPPWPPSGQQQQAETPQATQNYWDIGGEFRFHS